MAAGAEIVGLERVLARYSQIERAIDDGVEELAVAAALPIANEAKRIVTKKTGTLARSIHIGGHADLTPDTKIGGDRVPYSNVASPKVSAGSCTVYVGTNVPYAAIIEYGGTTRLSAAAKSAMAKYGNGAVGVGAGLGGGGRPPKPYLRPAMDSSTVHEKCVKSLHRGVRALIVREGLR